MKKKKFKIVVNNKLRGDFGAMNPRTNKVEVNLRAHKKNGKIYKAELASTIRHELLHVKHPKMTEKEVYKRSAKTKLSPSEQSHYLAKLRNKTLNYKVGAAKRKLKLNGELKPGELISNMNSQKAAQHKAKSDNSISREERVAIMGIG